jgi:hypothetical protein
MYRIDNSTSVGIAPTVPAAGTEGYFTEITPATTVDGWWLNMIQDELRALALMKGGGTSKTNNAQCADALAAIKAIDADATDTGSITSLLGNAVIASETSKAASSSVACVVGSTGAEALGERSSVVASWSSGGSGNVEAGADQSFIAACGGSASAALGTLTGAYSAIIASYGNIQVSGSNSFVAACDDGTFSAVTGDQAAIIAATEATVSGANSVVIASSTCDATAGQSAVIASEGNSQANGQASAVIAAGGASLTEADFSLIAASDNCEIETGLERSAIVASYNSTQHTLANNSFMAGSYYSHSSAWGSILLGSQNAELADDFTLALGWATGAAISPLDTNQNLTFKVDGTTGQIHSDSGSISTPADYAEYFENSKKGALAVGSLIAFASAKKVKLATTGDPVLGVVSANPAFCGNAAPLNWRKRYMVDDFGAPVMEEIEFIQWSEESETVREMVDGELTKAKTVTREAYSGPISDAPDDRPENARIYKMTVRKQNPDFDSSKAYVSRGDRPDQWTPVGLLGQLRVRVAADVAAGDYLEAGAGGIGAKASGKTGLYVMDIFKAFADGFAIADVFVK